MTSNGLLYEFWSAARHGPRMYFAPLVGAIRAVRDEIAPTRGAKYIRGPWRAADQNSYSRPLVVMATSPSPT